MYVCACVCSVCAMCMCVCMCVWLQMYPLAKVLKDISSTVWSCVSSLFPLSCVLLHAVRPIRTVISSKSRRATPPTLAATGMMMTFWDIEESTMVSVGVAISGGDKRGVACTEDTNAPVGVASDGASEVDGEGVEMGAVTMAI